MLLGCYEASLITANLVNAQHPNLFSFKGSTLQLIFKTPTLNATSLKLTDLIEFTTDHPQCGANKITAYSDSTLTLLSTATDSVNLETNPSSSSPVLKLSYGITTLFPTAVFLKVETNDRFEAAKVMTLEVQLMDPCILSSLSTNSSFSMNSTFTNDTAPLSFDLLAGGLFVQTVPHCKVEYSLSDTPGLGPMSNTFIRLENKQFVKVDFQGIYASTQLQEVTFYIVGTTLTQSTAAHQVVFTRVLS